jgi:formylglycine-generating enzyme required for sulfatase activity
MSENDAGEYELADAPEPRQPKPPPPPGKPLPRLWKTEPEDEEEDRPPEPAEKPKKPPGLTPPSRAREGSKRSSHSKVGSRDAKAGSADGEKKALVEETPALDTYEARQRGRLVVSGLLASCVAIFGWIFYQLFFYDPNRVDVPADQEEPAITTMPPAMAPKHDLDVEARNMLSRAEETAKAGNTKEAIALLENVVKSYRGTKTASEAQEALDRPKNNLPLFLDRPAVKAEHPPQPAPSQPEPPPQVVHAEPKQTQGNARLLLPANPAEQASEKTSPLAMASPKAPTAAVPVPKRPLPAGFRAQSEAGVHGTGWPLVIVGDRDGAPMMLVPDGMFTVGNDSGAPAETPAHKVRLSTYYIDQHEVTIRQFRLFLKESHYRGQPPRSWSEDHRQDPVETLPMVMVNARDAQAYAEWAQKRLPTEAQWESAARSTDGRLYPWGSQPASPVKSRAAGQLDPVMSSPEDVSPYGVHDLGGSVLEWTKDWYDSKYYRQIFNQTELNPTGPSSRPRTMELVVKGDRKTGSASTRQGVMLEKRLTFVGFRCVLPVEGQGSPFNPAAAPVQAAQPGGQPPASPPPGGRNEPAVPF